MGVLWTTDKLYSEKKKETKYNIFGWEYYGLLTNYILRRRKKLNTISLDGSIMDY